jgi:hypothetical protein
MPCPVLPSGWLCGERCFCLSRHCSDGEDTGERQEKDQSLAPSHGEGERRERGGEGVSRVSSAGSPGVSEMVRLSSPCSMSAPCHLTTDRQHRAESGSEAQASKQADDDPPAGWRENLCERLSRGRIRREQGGGGDQEAVWLLNYGQLT